MSTPTVSQADRRTPATRLADAVRRLLTVVLVAGILATVPGLASAKFTGKGQGAMSVGTASLAAPTNVSWTSQCLAQGSTEGLFVDVNWFSGTWPAGTSFTYKISRPGTIVTSTSTSRSIEFTTGYRPSDNGTTTWVVSISPTLGSWTGTAWTRSVVC